MVSLDCYFDIDVILSINQDSMETVKVSYELNYNIVSPELTGEIKVSTKPSLTIDSNNNLSGEVIIEGKNRSKISIVYHSNGVTHYLNGELFTPIY